MQKILYKKEYGRLTIFGEIGSVQITTTINNYIFIYRVCIQYIAGMHLSLLLQSYTTYITLEYNLH